MITRLGPAATRQIIQLANLSPSKQRLVIGATAIVTHTSIDAFNPLVDEDTRKYSAARSAIKALVTMTSGVITREIGQKIGEYAVNAGKITPPPGIEKAAFASSLGRVFAITGAVISIFLIDVPFINRFLNLTMNKMFNKEPGANK